MIRWCVVIEGAPRSKKNSLRILRGKAGRPFVAQSAEHNTWAQKAVWQLRNQWRRPPVTAPVNMAAVVYREKAVGDLLNYLAAVSDALEAAGVIANDRQVVTVDGCRMEKDKARPRVEVEITEVGE